MSTLVQSKLMELVARGNTKAIEELARRNAEATRKAVL